MKLFSIVLLLYLALILTVIIELIGALILKIRDKEDLLNIVLINVITNSILNSILLFINTEGIKYIIVILLEIVVVIVEYLFYKKRLNYKKINPLIISIILNVLSYSIGLLISIIL